MPRGCRVPPPLYAGWAPTPQPLGGWLGYFWDFEAAMGKVEGGRGGELLGKLRCAEGIYPLLVMGFRKVCFYPPPLSLTNTVLNLFI